MATVLNIFSAAAPPQNLFSTTLMLVVSQLLSLNAVNFFLIYLRSYGVNRNFDVNYKFSLIRQIAGVNENACFQ